MASAAAAANQEPNGGVVSGVDGRTVDGRGCGIAIHRLAKKWERAIRDHQQGFCGQMKIHLSREAKEAHFQRNPCNAIADSFVFHDTDGSCTSASVAPMPPRATPQP